MEMGKATLAKERIRSQQTSQAPSRAPSVHPDPEQDNWMPDHLSTARFLPRGTGDDPFTLGDLDTDVPKGGRLEGNPPDKFDGNQANTNDFLIQFQ